MGKSVMELAKAFFRREDELNIVEHQQEVYSLRTMVKELLTLSDNDWIRYAFSREPIEGKISFEDKLHFGYLASVCGKDEAGLMGRDIEKSISALGLTVKTPDLPNGGANVTFAQYEEDGTITIFMDTVKKAQPVLNELEDLLGSVDIFKVLLMHEMFHAVEQKKADIIYTQTKKIELWVKPFSNLSKIGCLSEIAAMSFAGSMLDLPYNPYIFDVILMYLYNQEAASMLFDEIMDIKKEIA